MNAVTVQALLKETEDHMQKSLDATKRDLATVRTGKATPALLDSVRIEYYGTLVPLRQVATVSAPEARMLTVSPFDKSSLGVIEKAIQASEMGLNPSNDGGVIRVPIPALTEERRRELVKVARGMVEHGRVAVRNIRHHTNDRLKHMEKDGALTKDEHTRASKRVQEMTDDTIKKLDEMLKVKEAEVMEV